MRALVLIGTCVVGIGLVLGFTVFARNDAKAAKPILRIVQSAPAKVRGQHFRPGEVVRVTAGKRAVRTTANGNGTFIVTIPGSSRCDGSRVRARGSAGSYAVVKVLPAPECNPARSS
jgi:hypothetical protein